MKEKDKRIARIKNRLQELEVEFGFEITVDITGSHSYDIDVVDSDTGEHLFNYKDI